MRIAANEVSFIDERAWDKIYTYNPGLKFTKSPNWYQPQLNGAYGIMSTPNAEHNRFRRTFASAFTDKAVQEQEGLILRHSDLLVAQLRKEASNKQPLNVLDWFSYAVLDILGDLCFSESFDCLENTAFRHQIDILKNSLIAFTQAVIPRVLGLGMLWRSLVPKAPKQKRNKLVSSMQVRMSRRLDEGEVSNKKDFVTFASRHNDEKGLSKQEMGNSFADIIVAGSETVTTTLTAITFYMTRSPEIGKRLTDEVRNSFQKETDITGEKVAELPYVNAAISEAFRLSPATPMAMPRLVPESGAEVCGYWFPGGVSISTLSPSVVLLTENQTLVTFCPVAANLSSHNFSSPEDFIPTRWLPESTMKIHNTRVYHPFSTGPRNCIGKGFGLLEVRVILAKLLWNFDIARAGEESWKWHEQKTYFVLDKKPLFVNLSPVSH